MRSLLIYTCAYLLVASCRSGGTSDPQSDLNQTSISDVAFPKHLNFSKALSELMNISPQVIAAFEIERQKPETFQEKISLLLDETKFKLKYGLQSHQLKNAMNEVQISPVIDARASIHLIDKKIEKLNQKSFELLEMRPNLRENGGIIDMAPGIQSQVELDKELGTLKKNIEKLESDRQEKISLARNDINAALGSTFSEDQTSILLLAPDSDYFVKAVAVFMNYSPIVNEILRQAKDPISPATNSRLEEFQSAYISLIGILRLAQDQYIVKNYEQEKNIVQYRAKIAEEIKVNEQLLNNLSGSEKKQIEGNIAKQYEIMNIASKYRDYLNAKAKTIFDSNRELFSTLTAAISTYRLMKSANELLAMLVEGIMTYEQIGNLIVSEDLANLELSLDELNELSKVLGE